MQDVTNRSRVDVAEVERDAEVLLAIFAEVLADAGRPRAAAALPLVAREPVALDDDDVLAATIGFHLIGIVEQRAAHRYRHVSEARGEMESGLWASTVRDQSAEALRSALASARVEIVLTAHPTEARRRTALEQYRELYALLPVERPVSQLRADERSEIAVALERLFRFGEVRIRKPDLEDEQRYVIDVLTENLPAALEASASRLSRACGREGLDLSAVEPRVTFATWVGGDRDGHPLVTGDVTREALARYRRAALALHRSAVERLVVRMGLSGLREPPPPELERATSAASGVLGEAADDALARREEEPFRAFARLVLARLPPDEGTRPGAYATSAELEHDLGLLARALDAVRAHRIARHDVLPLQRAARAFGFHLVRLDIRQNSRVHELAADELRASLPTPLGPYSSLDEPARLAWIEAELAETHGLVARGARPGEHASRVLDALAACREHLDERGGAGLGALIVSMTRSVSDLLVVHLLAREGGIFLRDDGGPAACPLEVVPLFETIEDLERAPSILAGYLRHAAVRRSAELRASGAKPTQQVMVGYSDSNKDGGICASLAAVNEAQRAMLETAAACGVALSFFHGRGGSLSRGAGPSHRFLSAMPTGALAGGLRLTEQGETILQKYGNVDQAAYNIELLTAGTVRRILLDERPHAVDAHVRSTLDVMASASRDKYRSLVDRPGFLPFFRAATPIDVIETSGIGSRPSRRTGQASLADLRAIPWVFAWGQSRFGITGWYGFGTGFFALSPADQEAFAARALEWPVARYLVSNVGIGVLASDMVMARAYAELAHDVPEATAILNDIEVELAHTRTALERIYGKPLERARDRISSLLALRAGGLVPLHRRQIELLARWRASSRSDETLRLSLLATVNAIAAGLRTTG